MTYVGRAVPSLTNTKLVAGKGTFVDDISLPGMTHAAVLRSPHAHARSRSVDTTQAESLPGVLCVLTGREVKENMNPIPETYDTAAVGAKGGKWYALCVDRAPYGDTLPFWDSTQTPHPLRDYLAGTLGIPDTSIRVIQPHVGGGFGLKIPTFQEEPLVAYLARKLRRPVQWIEERG